MTTTDFRPVAVSADPVIAPRVSTARGVLGPSIASGVAVTLAALSIGPLVDSGAWFGPTLLTIAIVTAVGALATWLRVPVFLVPILAATALFATLVWRFASDAPLGFLPSPDALGQVRLVLADGMGDIDRYAPPVPVSAGVGAVISLGLGCVAIVVFVLTVCLRMPVVAGLALVAVYVVPSFVLDEGSPWWAFAAIAVGWMVLLISDQRVGMTSWGRMLRRTDAAGPRSAMSGLSSTALRLGTLAIIVAVALPILIPSLTDAVRGRNGGAVGGPGTGDGAAAQEIGLSPFVSLRRDLVDQPDVVVLRYTTSATAPSYLRTVVLEVYADEKWSMRDFSPASSTPVNDGTNLATAIGADIPSTPEHYTLTADKLVNPYLPVPEDLTSLTGITGQWYADAVTGTIFSKESTTRGQTWDAEALDVRPTTAQLQAAPSAQSPDLESLRTTAGVPEVLAVQARSVTSGATTDFERALALQRWFLNNFTYSTDVVSDQSSSYLQQFLTDRTGYCQQFAATMALMARSLGIPARVVVGYTQGTVGADGTTWTVKAKDAHAWPELSFPGVGWVRFEPTPRGTSEGGTVSVPAYAGNDVTTAPPSRPTPTLSAKPGGKLNALTERQGGASVPAFNGPDAVTTADEWRLRVLLALLVVIVIAAAVPSVWRQTRRRRRLSASGGIEDAWDELRDTARDLGVPWADSMTPRQAVASVIDGQHLRGEAAEAATRVGRTTERARYAPTAPDTDGLMRDVVTVRTALLGRVDRSTRVRALLFPVSLRRRQG